MYVQIPLRKILSALRDSFHSIDIRSAVKKNDSGWLCLLTAIRISARSVAQVTLRHQKLIEKSPTIHADPFRVLLQASPFSEIDSLLSELANASLTVDGERVVLPQSVLVDQAQSMVDRWNNFVLSGDDEVWPSAIYSFGTRQTGFQDSETSGAVIKNGWESVESTISYILGVSRQDLYSLSSILFIHVEMPAQIRLVSIDDQFFEIHVKAEKTLSNLTLHWKEKTTGEISSKLALDKYSDDNGFMLLRTIRMKRGGRTGDEEFSCWLTHEGVPVVDAVTGRFRDFLPFAAVAQSERIDHAEKDLVTGNPTEKQQPERASNLHPWGVISAFIFDLDSDEVVNIISLTGLAVDWSVTPKESYSHSTRKRGYRPRVDMAFSRLNDSEKLRVAWVVSSELVRRHPDKETELRKRLSAIGWTLDAGVIRPSSGEVVELFFPKGSEHDAYIRLRSIIQSAKKSITVVDPYLDSSILTLLGTSGKSLEIQLLSCNLPADFIHEVGNFKKQHMPRSLEVRRTREFHDRFIVVDDTSCFHIGASIKDAGGRAFPSVPISVGHFASLQLE